MIMHCAAYTLGKVRLGLGLGLGLGYDHALWRGLHAKVRLGLG